MTVDDNAAASRHGPSWLEGMRHLDEAVVKRFAVLYVALVVYELTATYMLAAYIGDLYHYFHMVYDPARQDTYLLVCFLTPLAILPAGTRLESASQFLFTTFMTFVGLPAPLFLVNYVAPDTYWSFYFYLFVSYLLLAISTRLYLKPLPALAGGERTYIYLLAATVLIFAAVFAIGMTQNFHIVSFAELYKVRYSGEDQSGAFIQRIVNMYIFSFGGFFIGICIMFRKYALAALPLAVYVICYGLVQYKTAVLAPIWIVYIFLAFRLFVNDSTLKYYIAGTLPFWFGVALFLLFPAEARLQGGKIGTNVFVWLYLNMVNFRSFSVTPNALGLYYNFFQSHIHTYWSQISGLDFFLHYPYGNHTIAIEMDRRYGLGNYNSNFLATEGIESYGYHALPIASAMVSAAFTFLNTAARGIPPRILAVMMIAPALYIDERPFVTSLLTAGLFFLLLYLAWFPRTWLKME